MIGVIEKIELIGINIGTHKKCMIIIAIAILILTHKIGRMNGTGKPAIGVRTIERLTIDGLIMMVTLHTKKMRKVFRHIHKTNPATTISSTKSPNL